MARKAFRTIKIEGISSKTVNTAIKKLLQKEKQVLVYFEECGDLRKRLITKEGLCTVAYKGEHYNKWSSFRSSCFFDDITRDNIKRVYGKEMVAFWIKRLGKRLQNSDKTYYSHKEFGNFNKYDGKWNWYPAYMTLPKMVEKYPKAISLDKTLKAMKEHDEDDSIKCLQIAYGKGFKKRLDVITPRTKLN